MTELNFEKRARIVVDFSDGASATFEDMRWTASHPALQRLLDARMTSVDTGPWDPWPAMTVARDAAEQYGGEIGEASGAPEHKKGLVY